MAVPLKTENLSVRQAGKSGKHERQKSRFRQGLIRLDVVESVGRTHHFFGV
jgi:hypothetical protein